MACVGKTAIGAELAMLLGCRFYDLDLEVEAFYGTPIERLQKQFTFMDDFRKTAAKVLEHILSGPESHHCVVALPPRGLMGPYWSVVRKSQATIIAIQDQPENILDRIVFFDVESRPVTRLLSDKERRLYLREIKKDISYFKTSYKKATMAVDISGLDIKASAHRIKDALDAPAMDGDDVSPAGHDAPVKAAAFG